MKITYLFFLLTALLPLHGIAQTANSLADAYLQKGLQLTKEQQLEAANSALDSAYQLFITAENYEQGIKTLETITDNLNQLGQLQKIEPRITSALKEELSVIDSLSPLLLPLYNNLSIIYRRLQKNDKALNVLDRTKQILFAKDTIKNIYLVNYYVRRGNILLSQFNTSKALNFFKKALFANYQLQGEEHGSNGTIVYNIAYAHVILNEYDQAIQYFNKAADIFNRTQGEGSQQAAICYLSIGIAYANQDKIEESIRYHKLSQPILIKHFGPDHYQLAFSHSSLAKNYKNIGDYEQAFYHYDEERRINEATYGARHPQLISYWHDVAQCYFAVGQFDKFKEAIQQSLRCNTSFFNSLELKDNPEFREFIDPRKGIASLVLKASLLHQHYLSTKKPGDLDQAFHSFQWAFRNLDQMMASPSIEEESKYSIFSQNINGTNIISIAKSFFERYEQNGNPQDLEKAFYVFEKKKASILRDAIIHSEAKSFSGIPDSIWQKEKVHLEKITQLVAQQQQLEQSQDNKAQYQKILDAILLEEQALEKLREEAVRRYPQMADLRAQEITTSLTDIQTALDEEEVYIAISNSTIKPFPFEFYFLLISKEEIQVISNPIADDLDLRIEEFRQLCQSAYLLRPDKQARFVELSHLLYEQLIAPIKTHLEGKKKLVFVVEGLINLIPFELLLPAGEVKPYQDLNYLIRDYEISYHYSATLWLRSEERQGRAQSGRLLAFAPVFGEQGKTSNLTPQMRSIVDTSFRAVTETGGIHPLHYSEKEVRDIDQLFKSKQQQQNTLLLHKEANEKALKQALEGDYSYVHIASHSFANVNQPKYSAILCDPNSEGAEDGVLYSAEVYNLKIPADLLVLSSCESGWGKLASSEGLIGLNRSFIYAGVPNVVFSGWKINDKISSTLMKDFYATMLDGQSYSAALRKAKLNMLKQSNTALPNLWGAYLYIGR